MLFVVDDYNSQGAIIWYFILTRATVHFKNETLSVRVSAKSNNSAYDIQSIINRHNLGQASTFWLYT